MKKASLFFAMFVALSLIVVLSSGRSALATSEEQSAQSSQEKKVKKQGMEMQGDMPMCCKRKMGGKAKTEAAMESMDEQKDKSKEDSAKEAKDPVCGMTVDPKTAEKSVHKAKTYYFCSKEDKEKFDKSPDKYAGKPKAN